jgi:hypothetical protein
MPHTCPLPQSGGMRQARRSEARARARRRQAGGPQTARNRAAVRCGVRTFGSLLGQGRSALDVLRGGGAGFDGGWGARGGRGAAALAQKRSEKLLGWCQSGLDGAAAPEPRWRHPRAAAPAGRSRGGGRRCPRWSREAGHKVRRRGHRRRRRRPCAARFCPCTGRGCPLPRKPSILSRARCALASARPTHANHVGRRGRKGRQRLGLGEGANGVAPPFLPATTAGPAWGRKPLDPSAARARTGRCTSGARAERCQR